MTDRFDRPILRREPDHESAHRKVAAGGRQGFQSLPEEAGRTRATTSEPNFENLPDEDATEDESLLNDAPVDDIYVERR